MIPYRLNLITGPTAEPVTREDLVATDFFKDVDFDLVKEQTLFDTWLLPHAREMAEQWLNRAIISQTWEMAIDYQPAIIEMPLGQLTSITSVTTIAGDVAETETIENTNNYSYSTGDFARVWLNTGYIWTTTTRPVDVMKIRFVCGWAAAANVPSAIKFGIMLAAVFYYENRQSVNVLPDEAKQAMMKYRIIRM
jgi:uncharacterized phiE125 gp8 family phage protein